MKIASWNINSIRVRLSDLRDWLEASEIDVIALQETKVQDADFPGSEIAGWGYQFVCSGQSAYNGVALLSRCGPIENPVVDVAGVDPAQKRVLAATVCDVRFIDLYAVQGGSVGSPKYHYKLEWYSRMAEFVGSEVERHRNLVVLGDFNVAPTDEDVHDPEKWKDQIMCTAAERAALDRMQALGLSDAFRLFDQSDDGFSWWDYRGGGFRRNHGLRIDLILLSRSMSLGCRRAFVDREPRGWERPSDHAPVVAEFDLD